MVLVIVFLLGIGVTFAEPAIGALKTTGSIIQVERAPYLYSLLNDWADVLVLTKKLGAQPVETDFGRRQGRYPIVVDCGLRVEGLHYALGSTEAEGICQSVSFFPLPETPVTQVKRASGKAASISRRLCSRAPRTVSQLVFLFS